MTLEQEECKCGTCKHKLDPPWEEPCEDCIDKIRDGYEPDGCVEN